jgi:replicative DNA helicase Mcm
MDKMSKEDTSAMHEAMEQQTISISKANIQATLPSKTTVLAAANPKFGRFDSYQNLFTQIDMPPALINRFDLIFIVRDIPDPESDKRMAKHILQLHKNPEVKNIIDDKLLRKYFAYAKQNIKPELTEEALKEIEEYYVKMRNQTGEDGNKTSQISKILIQTGRFTCA